MKVEVLRFTPFNGQGSLKGFAEIKIADKMILRDVRLIQVAGKPAFVSPPQKEYTNREGEKKYSKLAEWPQEWEADILNAIVAASVDDTNYPQEPPQRQQYTPQGGSRQDTYHSGYQAPPQRQPARRAPAPPPDYDDEELSDPFMD